MIMNFEYMMFCPLKSVNHALTHGMERASCGMVDLLGQDGRLEQAISCYREAFEVRAGGWK